MTQVAIIGAGAIGQALAHILRANKKAVVSIYDKDPAKVVPAKLSLSEISTSAEILFLCIPSWAMREVLSEVKPRLKSGAILVSLAKGIEPERKKTMDALLAEILPRHHAAILGGPMLAAEIMKDMPAVGCLAAADKRRGRRITELFSGTLLSFEVTNDVRGAALSGALKNIYALGLGIASGLYWGSNEKGWYLTHALFEMADIAELFGGKRETAYSLAGVGDLVATSFSSYSRNSRFGEEIARNGICSIKSEGCASLPILAQMLGEKRRTYPLFLALDDVINNGADAKERFERLSVEASCPPRACQPCGD